MWLTHTYIIYWLIRHNCYEKKLLRGGLTDIKVDI